MTVPGSIPAGCLNFADLVVRLTLNRDPLFQRVNALSVVHSRIVTALLAFSFPVRGAVTAGTAGFLPFRLFKEIRAGSGIPATKLPCTDPGMRRGRKSR